LLQKHPTKEERENKERGPKRTLEPLFVYTQTPKVKNLLQKHPTKEERENKERGPKAEVEAKD
jgi:hypothetical protein